MTAPNITLARLRELLSYDPAVGILLWRKDHRRARAGCRAGTVERTGEIRIKIDGRFYKAHRLCWLYHYERWPRDLIDHINHDRGDNRISNLREANASLNMQNKVRAHRGNRSGFLGVTMVADDRYRAQIGLPHLKRRLHLGYFRTGEAAHAAYVEAKRRWHAGCTI